MIAVVVVDDGDELGIVFVIEGEGGRRGSFVKIEKVLLLNIVEKL